jgi:hypothetical protein
MNCQNNALSQREVEAVSSLLSQTALLLDEACAFSYALTMTLARTPRQNLSEEEIDGLCLLAYNLLNKLTKTNEVFQETQQKLRDGRGSLGHAATLRVP